MRTLDDAELLRDPVLAALDPDLDSVLNVNTPPDYDAARARPAPEVTVQLFGTLAKGSQGGGPHPVRAATVGAAADAVDVVFDRHVTAALNGDQITRDPADPAGGGRHRLLPVRRRGGIAAMPAGGYFGRALVVDATSGTSRDLPLPDGVLRGYIGGSGLGTWLLYRLGTPGADPLGPAAPLAFVFSPLVGTPLTTSAKFAVVAKSPLTGMLTDALASSQFAIAGKLTGHDAIVIDGRAPELSVLLVDGDGTRLVSAAHLAGLTGCRYGPATARRTRPRLAGGGDRPGRRARRQVRHDLARRAARGPRRPGRGHGREEPEGDRGPRRGEGGDG